MRYLPLLLLALLIAAALISREVPSSDADPGVTTRVSASSAGIQGNDWSFVPFVSEDARYVAFSSFASNLVSGDTNGSLDGFVRDRVTNATTRVTVATGGGQGNSDSYVTAISADARYVAFGSFASNMVAGDSNGSYDAFVRDRQTGTTERVSVDSAENQGNADSYVTAISADARYVAFNSVASNLVPGDGNNYCDYDGDPILDNCADVFVRDRQAGTTERVSVDSAGSQGNSESGFPSMSSDGRYLTFHSLASNLVAGDTNGFFDVFVRDRQAGTTERVSVNSAGGQGNSHSGNPKISADGLFVAFESFALNLVPGDTNFAWDAFVRDRQSGTTERVSIDSAGDEGDSDSGIASISGDGRFVAFESFAINLAPGDINGVWDVFVRDRQTGKTQRVSVDSAGSEGNDGSYDPSISAAGRYIAFDSDATNLASGDSNAATDVFVHDLGDGDADGQWDPFDNCPTWANADQSPPPWPVPPDDPDCDGSTDAEELFMGTAPSAGCPATGVADDIDNDGDTAIDEPGEGGNDESPDAWPPDADDDQDSDIGDLMLLFGGGKLLIGSDNPLYQARSDFAGDGDLDVGDVLKGFRYTILKRCV
jgi:hypothetical protein